VLSKDFESGILKLEQKLEGTLTVAEGIAIKRFEIVTSVPIVPAVATVVPAVAVAEPAFIEQMYKKIKLTQELVKQRSNPGKYRSIDHVRPTSNWCERLFSQCKLIKNDHRRRMLPSNLEICLFLKTNRHLWTIRDLQLIINKGDIRFNE